MKKLFLVALCAGTFGASQPLPVEAASGVINRACRTSGRPAATKELCGCIQKVANHTLTRSERKRVSKFFADPHKAQELRQSDKGADETLWKRYKVFGSQARKSCG